MFSMLPHNKAGHCHFGTLLELWCHMVVQSHICFCFGDIVCSIIFSKNMPFRMICTMMTTHTLSSHPCNPPPPPPHTHTPSLTDRLKTEMNEINDETSSLWGNSGRNSYCLPVFLSSAWWPLFSFCCHMLDRRCCAVFFSAFDFKSITLFFSYHSCNLNSPVSPHHATKSSKRVNTYEDNAIQSCIFMLFFSSF